MSNESKAWLALLVIWLLCATAAYINDDTIGFPLCCVVIGWCLHGAVARPAKGGSDG